MWQYQNSDELYHHGILGMKWGVRRYQNADGTLTSAGRRRYVSDKTSGITDKKEKRKAAERYGKKYDRKAKKHNEFVKKTDDAVKTYGKNYVKVSDAIAGGSVAYGSYVTARAIAGIGAAKIRRLRFINGGYDNKKTKAVAAASLAALAGVGLYTAKMGSMLRKQSRLASTYDDRMAARERANARKKRKARK